MISRRSLFGLLGGAVTAAPAAAAELDFGAARDKAPPWVSVYADAVNEMVFKEAATGVVDTPVAMIRDENGTVSVCQVEHVSTWRGESTYLVVKG